MHSDSSNNKMFTFVTHDGVFHGDEVCAFTMLNILYPKNTLIRSRKQEDFDKADYIFDVGKVYDPKNNKFDHHQEGCNETFTDNHSILLSSAGMVYKKYGKQMIETIINKDIPEDVLDVIHNKFYNTFVVEIDAIDNGISACDKPKYYHATSFSSTISKLNGNEIYNYDSQMVRFLRGSSLCLNLMTIHIESLYEKEASFKQDYETICEAFGQRFNYSETGEFIYIPVDCPNYIQCIDKYESTYSYTNDNNKIKFVIYKNNGNYRVKTVSHNFISRKLLLSHDELNKLIKNKDDLVFVHKACFIAETKNLETAIELCKFSL